MTCQAISPTPRGTALPGGAASQPRPPLPPPRHLQAAPPEARTCSTEPAESLSSLPLPLSPLITGHRSERRSRRTEQTLIDFHRRAAEGRGAPGERAEAELGGRGGGGGTNRGGTRRHPRREGVAPPGRTAARPPPRGRLWGRWLRSPKTCRWARGRLPGGQAVGGAAVCPFPRRRATLVQIAACHLPDGNHHPPLQKSRQPGTAASPVVHGNRRI